MTVVSFELRPESGEVLNVGTRVLGDIHLADSWQVQHDDGAVAVYHIHHGAIRLVAKAAIRDGTMFTRAGRNGVPRNDQWDRIARGLGHVLGRSIQITGAVSDTQVSDAGVAPLHRFATFDLDATTSDVSRLSSSREHELRAHTDPSRWQIVCVGSQVTVYGLVDGNIALLGRATRKADDLVDTTTPLPQGLHWPIVARGLAAATRLSPDALPTNPPPPKKPRGAIARMVPTKLSSRAKTFVGVGATLFAFLFVALVVQAVKMGTFPLWGAHVVFVPLAMFLAPPMIGHGLFTLTSKEALAERPTKDMYGNKSGDPLTSYGFGMIFIGVGVFIYPCAMINAAKHMQPEVPFTIPTFAPPPSSTAPIATPDAAPKPTLAETLARVTPTLGDGADNAGALELARFASLHLAWSDVAITTAETSIPLVLKDSALERGKRLCATGALTDIEREDLDARPAWAGALRTTDGDDVRFIAVGSSGTLVKRSTATVCGIVTGRADKAVMIVGMFDLPENAQPAVER
jgi:hypothetical protein